VRYSKKLFDTNSYLLPVDVGHVYSYERNVTVLRPSVSPSIRLSVCFSVPSCLFLTLIERAADTQRDSPGGSMRRGQRTFQPDNNDDRHTC